MLRSVLLASKITLLMLTFATGLAMQIHHVSKILVTAHEPTYGGMEDFISRQKTVQESINVVCGIGMTVIDDASSMMSSQCLFIGK
jgi:hypothetical protein